MRQLIIDTMSPQERKRAVQIDKYVSGSEGHLAVGNGTEVWMLSSGHEMWVAHAAIVVFSVNDRIVAWLSEGGFDGHDDELVGQLEAAVMVAAQQHPKTQLGFCFGRT